jgi:hypothetical protein
VLSQEEGYWSKGAKARLKTGIFPHAVNAVALGVGLFLVGLSVIPILYGYSATINPSGYGLYGGGSVSGLAVKCYVGGGILLASGLALGGYGIAEKYERLKSPEENEQPKRF